MTIMQCMNCGASILASDKFCEECGIPLTASKPPTSTNGCEKCGAGIEAIDAEGYCSNCGFRQESRERNRLEAIVNSELAGVSDRGLKHHSNEDFLALQHITNSQTNILVVCDGVSSSAQADLAAQTAAQSVCLALTNAHQEKNLNAAIKSAFAIASTSVSDLTYTKNLNSDPPSTTIVAAIVQNGTATIGWLGDSRAYWISAHSCQQLTQDNSWLTEVVAAGEMTLAEAIQSPNAHAITRWLGADAVENAEPSIVNFTIPGSGNLILCTDGLWNYLSEAADLGNLVERSLSTDAVTISRTLVEFALNRGGHDNITVAVLRLIE